MQRVRVGMIGLAAVILLIGLASVLFSGVRDQRGRTAAGGADSAVVANITSANGAAVNESDEPLADLGVAPGSASVDPAANQTR
ncbi:hypothetical protein [Sphingomonas lenta]|uniref:Uncharacterized protein n=1 Tax=Sphingomonas lenta TaxID=1141887 RepID=A0A2A2SIS1_9SPHN|nr:hypothetical protein [Sphingomonas lenta]PAX09142.1 hypothetical protein CKY28_04955 [Sphingomonas lenta]